MAKSQDQYDNPKPQIFSSFDLTFVTGDSPVSLDIKSTLLRNGVDGFIDNFGQGALTYSYSSDGVSFGDEVYLPPGAQDDLRTLSIDTLRITWVSDTSYEVRIT